MCNSWLFFQLYQAALRELSEETGLRFSENDLNISTLGLWEVQYSANFLGLSKQCTYNCNSLGCLQIWKQTHHYLRVYVTTLSISQCVHVPIFPWIVAVPGLITSISRIIAPFRLKYLKQLPSSNNHTFSFHPPRSRKMRILHYELRSKCAFLISSTKLLIKGFHPWPPCLVTAYRHRNVTNMVLFSWNIISLYQWKLPLKKKKRKKKASLFSPLCSLFHILNLWNSYIYHLIFIVLLYAKQLMASFQTSWLVSSIG